MYTCQSMYTKANTDTASRTTDAVKPLGYDFFHVDEGYQYACRPLSRWHEAPRRRRASLGLTFGVWTAPFEVSERAWVFLERTNFSVNDRSDIRQRIGD